MLNIFFKKKPVWYHQHKSTAYFDPETYLSHITLCKNGLVPKKETSKKWQGLENAHLNGILECCVRQQSPKGKGMCDRGGGPVALLRCCGA